MRSMLVSIATLGIVTPAMAGQNILSWNDNSNNEKGFQIARKVGACAGTGTWYIRTNVGPDVKTFTDTGLTIGATYCYKVRAYNGYGVSAYSNMAEGIAKPSPTCGTVKTVLSDGTIVYTWVCH